MDRYLSTEKNFFIPPHDTSWGLFELPTDRGLQVPSYEETPELLLLGELRRHLFLLKRAIEAHRAPSTRPESFGRMHRRIPIVSKDGRIARTWVGVFFEDGEYILADDK